MIVLISIISLFSLIVLSQARLEPLQCILPAGIACTDYQVLDDSLKFAFRNGLGFDTNIMSINVGGCSGTDSGYLINGEQGIFTVDGCEVNKPGSKSRRDLKLTYSIESTGSINTIEGWVGIKKARSKFVTNLFSKFFNIIEKITLVLFLYFPVLILLLFKFFKYLKDRKIIKIIIVLTLIPVLPILFIYTVSSFQLFQFSQVLIFNVPLIVFYFIYSILLREKTINIKINSFILFSIFLVSLSIILYYLINLNWIFALLYYSVIILPFVTFLVFEKFFMDKPKYVKVIIILLELIVLLNLLIFKFLFR